MSEWPMVTCTCRSYNLGTVLFGHSNKGHKQLLRCCMPEARASAYDNCFHGTFIRLSDVDQQLCLVIIQINSVFSGRSQLQCTSAH